MDNLTYYLEILKLEPENISALKGIAEIYKANKQWNELIEVYEKLFSLSEETDDRLSYLLETAGIYYYNLNDSSKAIEFYLDALEFQPEDLNTVNILIEIFDTLKSVPELDILLEGKSLLVKDAPQAASLTGQIIDNYISLKMYDEALSKLSALKDMPQDTVKTIYDDLNKDGILSSIFEYRELFINTLKSPGKLPNDELANLYSLLADLYERVFGDIYETACNYELALGVKPDNQPRVISKLYSIYTSSEYTFIDEPVLLIPVLLKMKESPGPGTGAGLDKTIGMNYLKLNEPLSALPFLKTSLSTAPDDIELLYTLLDIYTALPDAEGMSETIRKLLDMEHDDSKKIDLYKKALPIFIGEKDYDTAKQFITALAGLTGDQSHYALLEQIYADTGDYNSLVTFYLERLQGREEEKDSAVLWASLGNAYLKGFSHYEYAIDSYNRALAISPDNLDYLGTLVTLYSSAERWPDAEQTILKLIRLQDSDTDKKTSLQLMLGDIYLTHDKDYDKAAVLYNGLLTQNADNDTALMALERIYRENSDYANLVKILEKKLGTADDKYDLLIELGSILFDRSIDILKAQNYLWQALEQKPESTYAIDVIKRLYETTGDFNGFDRLYSFLIDKSSGRTKVELLLKLGHIRYEKLAMPERAIQAFEEVLSIAPDNHDANLSLTKLYFNAGAWDKAELCYNFSISHTLVKKENLPEFVFEYARILDKVGKQEQALQFYKKAFELDGTEKKYVETYGNSAYANNDNSGVIAAFEALLKLPRTADKPIDNINEIYRRLASAYEAAGDFRTSSIYLMKLIEKEPKSLEHYQWLERLSTNSSDYSLLASALKKEAELSETDEQKMSLTLRRAVLLDEHLNEPQSAVKVLLELIKSGQKHLDIYLKLSSLYKKQNNSKELTATIREILKFEIPGEQRVDLLLELAGIQKDNKETAMGIYTDVLHIQPDNTTAFSALAGIYDLSGDYKNLSALYEERLPRMKSNDELIDLQKKLALIKVEKLNDPGAGIALYQNIIKLKPSDSGTYPLLESLLLKKDDAASLDQFYKIAASNAGQKDAKFNYFVKSAELLLSRMNDEKGALQSYESAYTIDTSNTDVLIKLARLTASQQGSSPGNDKALSYYKEAIKLKSVPDETRAALNFEYGGMLKNSGKVSEAYQAYKDAHTISPSHIDYRLAYGEAAYAAGLYKDAYDVLKNVTYAHEQEILPEQLFPLYKMLSDIARRLGNIQQAVEYLLRAVDIHEKDVESLITLDELTANLGNFELESEVLTKLSRALEKPLDRAQVLIKIAKLKHDKLYDLNGAVPLLREAMAIMPDNLQIYHELIQIYREQSDTDNEIDVLARLLKVEKSTENFIATSMRLGEMYIKFKNDLDTAKKYYLEALKKEPSSIPALKGLGSILELQGNFSGIAELYQRFIKVLLPKEPKKVFPLIKELGELYTTKIKNNELAIQQYQTIVNIEPSDVDAHFALAELLSKNKSQITEAVREYSTVLKYKPDNINAIRFLSKFYEQKKDYDRVFLYYSTLKLIGQEKDMERIFVDANKNKQPQHPKSPLTDDLFHAHLLHMKTRGPLKDIINVFQDYGEHIYKSDLKLYGVGKQERITSKSTAWQEYVHLLQTLGIKDIDIYQTSKGNFKIVIENTDPPSLIVNTSALSGLSAGEKSFIVAEYLTYIKSGFTLPMKLGKQKFSLFINALIRIFNPSAATQHDTDPNLNTIQNAVADTLSKKQKTALEEPIKKYLKVANHYMDDWFAGIEMTGVRAASFMTGDIEPVFSSLVKWHVGDTSLLSNKEKRKDIFSSSELMQDMLQFYLSDSHFLLRSKLGMSILSV